MKSWRWVEPGSKYCFSLLICNIKRPTNCTFNIVECFLREPHKVFVWFEWVKDQLNEDRWRTDKFHNANASTCPYKKFGTQTLKWKIYKRQMKYIWSWIHQRATLTVWPISRALSFINMSQVLGQIFTSPTKNCYGFDKAASKPTSCFPVAEYQ